MSPELNIKILWIYKYLLVTCNVCSFLVCQYLIYNLYIDIIIIITFFVKLSSILFLTSLATLRELVFIY